MVNISNLMDGDKWGGKSKDRCWFKDGVKRFLVKPQGYKKCSPESCPKNDLGPFGDVSCQICCYIDEELKSSTAWETIGHIVLPICVVLLFALVVVVAAFLYWQYKKNRIESTPGSSEESVTSACSKEKLLKRNRHDSEKSNRSNPVKDAEAQSLFSANDNDDNAEMQQDTRYTEIRTNDEQSFEGHHHRGSDHAYESDHSQSGYSRNDFSSGNDLNHPGAQNDTSDTKAPPQPAGSNNASYDSQIESSLTDNITFAMTNKFWDKSDVVIDISTLETHT